MHQIVCRLGLRPRPHWGSLQRSPRPPRWFRGWGHPGKGKEGGQGERKERREGEGRGLRPGMPKSRVGKPSVGNWASPFRYQHGLAHRQASPFPCKNGIVRSLGRRSMLYRCCSAAAGASNDSAAAADLRLLSSSSSSSLAF